MLCDITVPALVAIRCFYPYSNVFDRPKSINLIGESSCFVKNKKFSGFKSL